jgi:hypothetical protein
MSASSAVKTLFVMGVGRIENDLMIRAGLGFLRSARRVKTLVAEKGARVIHPHDPDRMSGVKLLPDCHE